MISGLTHFKLQRELIFNKDEWEELISQIQNAKKYIFISTFFIEPDSYGYEFMTNMIAAARRGVHCIILIDQCGERLAGYMHGKKNDPHFLDQKEKFVKAGGLFVVNRPKKFIENIMSQIIPGGNHFKFFIFDNVRAIITGRNIGAASFERWQDYAVLFEGPVINYLLKSLDDLLRLNNSSVMVNSAATNARNDDDDKEEVFYTDFDPFHMPGKNLITQLFYEKISQAQSEILISSFMFKPTSLLRRAVIKAAQRGVKVKIIHSGVNALTHVKLPYWASACYYDELIKSGVEIYETIIPEHSKLVVIDKKWGAFGSYNFEFAAHSLLREGILSSTNINFVGRLKKILEERLLAQNSQRVESITNYQKLGYALMRPVSWLF